MIRNAKELSPDQKAAIKSLLGRHLLANEDISVRRLRRRLSPTNRRAEILHGLQEYFAKVDAQRQPASSDEADAILDEAMRSVRPNYRSIRREFSPT